MRTSSLPNRSSSLFDLVQVNATLLSGWLGSRRQLFWFKWGKPAECESSLFKCCTLTGLISGIPQWAEPVWTKSDVCPEEWPERDTEKWTTQWEVDSFHRASLKCTIQCACTLAPPLSLQESRGHTVESRGVGPHVHVWNRHSVQPRPTSTGASG